MNKAAIHNKIAKYTALAILNIVLLMRAGLALAFWELPPTTKSIEFRTILAGIANFVITIGIPAVAVAILFSGFYFISARGNPEKLGQARKILTWVIVGSAIILGALVIAEVVINFSAGLTP